MNEIIVKSAGANDDIAALIKSIYKATGYSHDKNLHIESSSVRVDTILISKIDVSILEDKDQVANLLFNAIPQLPREAADVVNNLIPKFSFDMLKYPTYKIFEINNKLACSNNKEDIILNIKTALDFMIENHNIKRCYIVNIDSEQFRSYISAIKILLLCDRFDLKEIWQVNNRISLESILPHTFEPLEYLDVLTRFAPFATNLTLSRHEGVRWYFYSDSIIIFKERWWLNSYFSEYLPSGAAPVANQNIDIAEIFGKCIIQFGPNEIQDYIDLMTLVVNNIFKYFLNISLFTDNLNYVDKYQMLISISTLKLIFADLKEINYSVSMHSRTNLGFSALDKISNLIKHVTKTEFSEKKVFNNIFLLEHCDLLKRIYKDNIKSPKLLSAFTNMLELSYKDILNATCQDEYKNASEIIRDLRNLKHGASLNHNKYEQLFFTNNIRMPQSIIIIPLLIIVGMALDPGNYFSYYTK